MPLPPDPPAANRPANPARVMLNSPLAAATRARVYHQRTRPRPRERGLRILAMVGALLVHLVFLFGFVLGPAFEVVPPPEPRQQQLQVRLIELPEPPPPPPVRGTPPKERGPRHQGRSLRPASVSERSANTEAVPAPTPAAVAPPVIAKAAKTHAPKAQPPAAPPAPVSLPQPAPTPELQPVPLAGEPPTVTLPTPVVQPPVPPKFQPEAVRRPQLEGNRPMPPPPSLALPELPPQAAQPITISSIALNTELPKSAAPASVAPVRAQLPVAPPVPELQPVPLPAQPSPNVKLQASLSTPAPSVPAEKPQLQAPSIEVAEAELEAVPLAPSAPAQVEPSAPKVKVEVSEAAKKMDVQTSIEHPQLSAPPAVAAAAAPAPSASSPPAESSPASAEQATPSPAEAAGARDVSRAPDATPQGSDLATPGTPEGVPAAPESASAGTPASTAARQGNDHGRRGEQPGKGQLGGHQPGAAEGERHGSLDSYVQLKPRGDIEIMRHGAPNIGYQPTRFEQDWTPEGESSIDTALRRAVEKTTVKHTFHLPRGVRVECSVKPLLPIALLGCANPDPPAKPVDAKAYERLHLAPANPVVAPAPAASRAAPAPMVKFDNAAECAAARVAGGPLPPGCEGIVLPVKPAAPAPSSSSWVPASDQFH